MENTLIHHGILGQKWGIRRFQNADGSLTAAGKERYSESLVKGGSDNKLRKTLKKETSKISTEVNKINTSMQNMKKQSALSKIDLSQMSDSELQKEINRMRLEQQYKSIKSSQTAAGQTYVQNVLNIAGSVVATTASALTIAKIIKELKGG